MIMVLLLALGASSAWADQIHHPVTEGESLWKIGEKYRVSWQKIYDANGLKSTKIIPGQTLLIPEKSKYAVVKKVAPSAKIVSIRKEKREIYKLVNSKFSWKVVGGNSYKGTAEWAIDHSNLPADIKVKVMENIKQGKFKWFEKGIGSGQHFDWMTFGKAEVREDFFTEWDSTLVYAAKDYGVAGYHVLHIQKCNNWGGWEEKSPPAVGPPSIIESPPTTPPKEGDVPSIFVNKEEEKKIMAEGEADVGLGNWNNLDGSAHGNWYFWQLKAYAHWLEENAMGGILTPSMGLYGRGDWGKTSADYKWNNNGWGGPEAGFMWNGKTDKGYPQQVQFMLRTLFESMDGKSLTSGYQKKENHFLVGTDVEYLRQTSPDTMHLFYSEIWYDAAKSFSSTWSGDKASDRTAFNIGYKFHQQWNDDWATRFGAQLGYQMQDHQLIASLSVEMRYDDWLMFGPAFDRTLVSDLACGSVLGEFIRFEFNSKIQKIHSESQSEEVQPADHELLQY